MFNWVLNMPLYELGSSCLFLPVTDKIEPNPLMHNVPKLSDLLLKSYDNIYAARSLKYVRSFWDVMP